MYNVFHAPLVRLIPKVNIQISKILPIEYNVRSRTLVTLGSRTLLHILSVSCACLALCCDKQ